MKRILLAFFTACAFAPGATGQAIALDWLQLQPYQVSSLPAVFRMDEGNGDIVSLTAVWLDTANTTYAQALNRRTPQGVTVTDTLLIDSVYDYHFRLLYPKNGETYFCQRLNSDTLLFTKFGTSGQVLWQSRLPWGRNFFAFDYRQRSDTYHFDDTLNNRILWCFEMRNAAYTERSTGIVAVDNSSGAISIVDTIRYTSQNQVSGAFVTELEHDGNGHLFLSSTDESGGLLISQLVNGQLFQEFYYDSAAGTCIDRPHAMEIVGSTLFLLTQTQISPSDHLQKLFTFSIDAAGHLTLLNVQPLGTLQQNLMQLEAHGSYCYAYTSGQMGLTYSTTPSIRKYDNAGNLVSTFTLPGYTGAVIFDLAISDNALYCDMYAYNLGMLEVLHPVTGAHLASHDMRTEFPADPWEGPIQVEAFSQNPQWDIIYATGHERVPYVVTSRIARYSFTSGETGTDETGEISALRIYPVPAGDRLTVEYATQGKYTAEVLDALGRVVLVQPCAAPRETLDVAALPAGTYFLRVRDAGTTLVKRFTRE